MNSRRSSTVLILFLVASTIVWFWYDGKIPFLEGKSFNLNVMPSDLSSLSQKTAAMFKDLKLKSDLTTKKALQTITKKPKEIISNVVMETKKSATESFKNQIADALGIIRVGDGNGGSINPSSREVAIVRPINQSLSILIKSEEGLVKYGIDWGDGGLESGSLEPNQQKVLDHSWQTMGDYSIKIEVENQKDNQKKSFVFPIRIK